MGAAADTNSNHTVEKYEFPAFIKHMASADLRSSHMAEQVHSLNPRVVTPDPGQKVVWPGFRALLFTSQTSLCRCASSNYIPALLWPPASLIQDAVILVIRFLWRTVAQQSSCLQSLYSHHILVICATRVCAGHLIMLVRNSLCVLYGITMGNERDCRGLYLVQVLPASSDSESEEEAAEADQRLQSVLTHSLETLHSKDKDRQK